MHRPLLQVSADAVPAGVDSLKPSAQRRRVAALGADKATIGHWRGVQAGSEDSRRYSEPSPATGQAAGAEYTT